MSEQPERSADAPCRRRAASDAWTAHIDGHIESRHPAGTREHPEAGAAGTPVAGRQWRDVARSIRPAVPASNCSSSMPKLITAAVSAGFRSFARFKKCDQVILTNHATTTRTHRAEPLLRDPVADRRWAYPRYLRGFLYQHVLHATSNARYPRAITSNPSGSFSVKPSQALSRCSHSTSPPAPAHDCQCARAGLCHFCARTGLANHALGW